MASTMPMRPEDCARSSIPCLMASIFFSPMPFETVELSLVDGLGEFVERGDVPLFPQEGDGLGAEAGDFQHGNQPGGDAGGDFVEILAFAGGDELFDDPLAGWADAFQIP